MTVGELVKILQTKNQDAIVISTDCDDGYDIDRVHEFYAGDAITRRSRRDANISDMDKIVVLDTSYWLEMSCDIDVLIAEQEGG